jgi:hypothetical protein
MRLRHSGAQSAAIMTAHGSMLDQALDGRATNLQIGRGIRGMFIGLRGCGLSVEQASNLTAHLAGIQPVPGGWSLAEVERLRFLRWMVSAGRLGADDVPPPATKPRTRRAA